MATLKRVSEAPAKLEKNEMVIFKPNFQEEIEANRPKRGISKRTTATSLRDIFMAITDKYDPTLNPYSLKLSKYEGLVAENDNDIRNVVSKIISDNDLPLVERVIEFHIKKRNPKIDTIYYVSDDLSGLGAFIRFGFNEQQTEKKVKVKE